MSAAYKAQLQMTELAVNQIVEAAFDRYEVEVALPRHTKNSDKLDELITIGNQIRGGVMAIKWILRVLGSGIVAAAALVKVIQAVRGH